jgi:hypothetical protein
MPLSDSVKGKEGSDDELLLWFGYSSEVRVSLEAGFCAEGDPSSPGAVPFFVGLFLFRFKDNSVIRSARMTKEEISLGSGEMTKPAGISCGRWS